jgi:MoaA/NifB/PqqE/SkfB family radical SAM enzyme
MFCSINNFRIQRLKTPIILTYFVTNKCNAKCRHCFYWKELGKDEELQISEIEKVVQSLQNRLSTLTLTGGEPFLREDLVDICRLFYKINGLKKINIPTNGIMPDLISNSATEILKKLKSFLSIVVSIDALQEKHDEIRGVEGAFEKAVKTVKSLKKLENIFPNFKVTVQTVISNYNIEELEPLAVFVSKELKVQHSFQFIRDTHSVTFGLDKDIIRDFSPQDKEFQLPPVNKLNNINYVIQNCEQNSEFLLNNIQRLEREYALCILIYKKRVMPCLAGKVDGVIYPNGEVALCETVKPFANLCNFDLDFEKLWHSVEANKMREKIKVCCCIHPCNLLSSMRYDYNSLARILSYSEQIKI